MPSYAYYIAKVGTGETVGSPVSPFNVHGYEITKKKEDDEEFYREELKGDIVLLNNYETGYLDYDWIKSMETSYKDSLFYFSIYKDGAIFHTSYFSIYDVSFDEDRERAIIKTFPYDDYQDVLDNWEDEVNVLDADKKNININYSRQLEFISSYEVSEIPSSPWLLFIDYISKGIQSPSIWARESIVCPTAYLPSGYTEVQTYDNGYSKYARTYTAAGYAIPTTPYFSINLLSYNIAEQKSYLDNWGGTSIGVFDENTFEALTGWERVELVSNDTMILKWYLYLKKAAYNLNPIYDNSQSFIATELITAINYQLSEIGFSSTCRSTFLFNSNLPSVCPSWLSTYITNNPTFNYVTEAENTLNKLYLIEKSNFKNPQATQAATVGTLKLNEVMEDLRILVNVFWYIDSEGYFRIEHKKYFNSELGRTFLANVSEDSYSFTDFNIRAKYKYKSEKIPKREEWNAKEGENDDFKQGIIKYDNVITLGKQDSIQEYSLNQLITDVDYVLLSQNTSDDGFMLVVCEEVSGVDTVRVDTGVVSGKDIQNGLLSFANLLPAYHTWGRYKEEGYINDVLTTMDSIQPLQEQESFAFKSDTEIDENNRIRTSLGDGIVDELTYKQETDSYVVKLVYDNLEATEIIGTL